MLIYYAILALLSLGLSFVVVNLARLLRQAIAAKHQAVKSRNAIVRRVHPASTGRATPVFDGQYRKPWGW